MNKVYNVHTFDGLIPPTPSTPHSSCIEAVASVHGRLKKKQSKEEEESYFTSLATSTEQVYDSWTHIT